MDLNQLVLEMNKYRDQYGVIVQADRDGGDTLNRTGVYYSVLAALDVKRDDRRNKLPIGFIRSECAITEGLEVGRFRRHPNPKRWTFNPDNVTRDQMAPFEAALALTGYSALARAHFWQRAKRLFFHFSTQNDGADAGPLVRFKFPDPPTLGEFGTLIRATKYKFLYFLLPVCDLGLLLDVKFGRSMSERSLYDTDNQLLPQVLAALNEPTFVTEYVRRAYATTDAAVRLRSYYAEGEGKNGIKPLGELAALAFERAVGGLDSKDIAGSK